MRRDETSTDVLWLRAVEIRREWLGHGLSTAPSDREAAERILTRLYSRLSRPRPRFVWVDSPRQALPLVSGLPTHDDLHAWVMAERSMVTLLAGDVATYMSRLRSALDAGCHDPDPPRRERLKKAVWVTWPAPRALAAGVPLTDVLRHCVWDGLATSLADGFHRPVRTALFTEEPAGSTFAASSSPTGSTVTAASSSPTGSTFAAFSSSTGSTVAAASALLSGSHFAGHAGARRPARGRHALPVVWYGQQDASWIAYYDTLRRLGVAHFTAVAGEQLDDWASLARTAGWWWPGEHTCVCVERPVAVDTETLPDGQHEEVRAVYVGYRDGWQPLGARALASAA